MTRMEKYAKKRLVIELENTLHFIEYPRDWFYIKTNQKKIKRLVGAKH